MRVERKWFSWLILALVASALPVIAQDSAAAGASVFEPTTQDLEYRTHRKWKLSLPAETFTPVGVGFPFEQSLGQRFAAKIEGTALVIDSDGDGTFDVKVEGTEGRVTLKGKTPSGRAFSYAVRLVEKGGWHFAAGGAATTKIDGVRVQIIDQNNNGSYADYGVDALVIGRSKAASFLSKALNVNGTLYEIDVAPNGSKITYAPFTGPTGTLKLDVDTKAKVLGAVLKSVDGQYSFEMSRAKAGLLVPAGKYVAHSGELGIGANRMKFVRGRSKSMTVAADKPLVVGWGGPVKAEFDYQRKGDKVGLSPETVWYYGTQGEQYLAFKPLGKSPKFTFTNKKTGREIATAYFPGTC